MAAYYWNDWLDLDFRQTPATLLEISSRGDLERKLSQLPNLANQRLKVGSSGHSTSDVAKPAQWLIRPAATGWIPDSQDASWLPAKLGTSTPYWVSAFTTIRDLNTQLAAKRLSLLNLGSYDAQTIYGAITTGTHGTGMISGPLADLVLAVDITCVVRQNGAASVSSYRIQPKGGVTNVAAFSNTPGNSVKLVEDDLAFRSVIVSMGLFGVVTGLVLRVEDELWLNEVRDYHPWSVFSEEAKDGTFKPETEDRCDLVMTPLPVRGNGPTEHRLVRTRRKTVTTTYGVPVPSRDDKRTRAARSFWLLCGRDRLAASRELGKSGSSVLGAGTSNLVTAGELDGDGPWTSRSDKVLFSSVGDYLAATSTEVAIPIECWADAVRALIAKLAELDQAGYHVLSPLGVRFVKGSNALLAHTSGRDSCTIETPTPLMAHKDHGPEANWIQDTAYVLGELEATLVTQFDGRPHWGQQSSTDPAVVRSSYGAAWDAWKAQRATFDPFGLFDNDFSEKYGL